VCAITVIKITVSVKIGMRTGLRMTRDEMVDIIDEQNNVLYQTTKHQAHTHGLLHRTVISLIKDSSGRWALVRQASDRQDAGQFVLPVGGHTRAGETEVACLQREAEEETGLIGFDYELVGRTIYQRHTLGRNENHFFTLFEIESEEELILNEESVEYQRFSDSEIQQNLRDNPQLFGDSFHFFIKEFYPSLL
jgi:8-oxo-dGTP pyrophosphatase MutT (NUDIX family)